MNQEILFFKLDNFFKKIEIKNNQPGVPTHFPEEEEEDRERKPKKEPEKEPEKVPSEQD